MAAIDTLIRRTKNIERLNILEICRTCATLFDESILIPAFDQIEVTTKTNSVFQLASELISLDIQIEKDDGLPQQVCINCVKQLTNIHIFRQICNESQLKLKALILGKTPCLSSGINDMQPVENIKPSSFRDYEEDEAQLAKTMTESADTEEEESISNEDNVFSDLEEDDIVISTDEEDQITDTDSDTWSEKRIDLHNEKATTNRRKEITSINLEEIIKRQNQVDYYSVGIISYHGDDIIADVDSSENRMDTREISINLRHVDPQKFPETRNIKVQTKSSLCKQQNNYNEKVLDSYPMMMCDLCKKYIHSSRYKLDARICTNLRQINKLQTVSASEFCCFYCDEKFEAIEIIEDHILKLHPIKNPFQCKICNEYFPTILTRQLHSDRNHKISDDNISSKIFNCDVCDRQFKLKCRRDKHKRLVHSDGNIYECEICLQKFDNEFKFNYHLRSHDKTKQFKCKYCERTFMQKTHVLYHEETHTNRHRPYKCNQCGKDFVHRYIYKSHLRLHEGKISYICDVCGKGFPARFMLNIHKYRHSYNIQCEICGKTFNTKNGLKQHHITHIPIEKRDPFKKLKNVKKKPQNYKLSKNVKKKQQNDDKLFTCPISMCSRKFVVPSALEKHMKVHDKNRKYKCDICQCSYIASNHLKDHINRAHSKAKYYDCTICGKRFYDSFYLNFHVKSHTEKYKCSYCNKSYSKRYIKSHERSHTEEKHLVCMICGKGFHNHQAFQGHHKKHSVEEIKEMEARILADNEELIQ